MSLAQKAETGSAATKLEVVAAPSSFKLTPPIDFRQLARRPAGGLPTLALAAAKPAAAVATPMKVVPKETPVLVTEAAPAQAPSVALELLAEVSTALSVLMGRCQDLETTLDTTREHARADHDAAHEAIQRSEQHAERLTGRVGELEQTIAGLKESLAAAEQHALDVQAMAQKSQHAAAEAECLSALFQERVINAFGVGSAGHSILESVRHRTQAMLTA